MTCGSARLSSLPAPPGRSFYMEDSFLSAGSWFLCSFICHQWHLIFLTAFVEDIVFLPVCIFGNFGKKSNDCSCRAWNLGLLVHLVCLHVCFCAGIMLFSLLCLCCITLDWYGNACMTIIVIIIIVITTIILYRFALAVLGLLCFLVSFKIVVKIRHTLSVWHGETS